MRSWFARHPISFMALYTVFYLTAFHWLEVNITVPAIWVHCQLDDVIPFCKYAIVPYFAWFAWIPFTLFYLLRHGERSDFWRVCLCLFAGMTIALSCYLLLPTGLALRPYRVYGSDIFARLVRMLYAVDSSKNVCPSIHVLNTVTLMIGYRRSRCFDEPGRRWMRPPRSSGRGHHPVYHAAQAAQLHRRGAGRSAGLCAGCCRQRPRALGRDAPHSAAALITCSLAKPYPLSESRKDLQVLFMKLEGLFVY